MTIQLVRFGDLLIGRTASDRWNLMQLGIGVIGYDRNHRAVKALRRKLGAEGFGVSVVRGVTTHGEATPKPFYTALVYTCN